MPRMQFNFKGLIQLLARHLYPEQDVFLRELVQNGHDAIQFRRRSEPNLAGRIDIITDARHRTITFTDNGIGMDRQEIVDFLSTIGSSGTGERTRELLAKGDKAGVLETIGQFGIGFLSAFVVADMIEVTTRKLGTEQVYRWTSGGDAEYDLQESDEGVAVGSRVTLTVNIDKIHSLQEDFIRKTLVKYADFLPFPIFLNGNGPINRMHAPWHASGAPDDSALRLFVSQRFPDHPLHIIPIHFEHPRALGVLYVSDRHIPGINTPGLVDIFQQRMCIRLNDQDLLPEWAKFVRGIIDSPDLTPTAARDNVQKDGSFHELRRQLGRAIVDSLLALAQQEPRKFERLCDWHHFHLKGMAVAHDDFFQAIIEHLPFETNQGMLNLRQYLSRQKAPPGSKVPLYYFSYGRDSNQFYELCSARGIVAINTGRNFEEELVRKYASQHEGAVELRQLDTLHDPAIFRPLTDSEVRTVRPLEDAVRRALVRIGIQRVTPVARHFEPTSLSSALIGTERSDALSRMEALLRDPAMREGFGELAEETIVKLQDVPLTLYLNVDNELIKHLLSAPSLDPDEQRLLLVGVYNAAFLNSQAAMTPENTKIFHQQFQEHMLRTLKLEARLAETEKELGGLRLELLDLREADRTATPDQEWIRVFVMLPYADRYRVIEDAIRDIFEAPPYCFEVVLARDRLLDPELRPNVRAHMRSADAFVADISEHSPNVLLELGWPHFDPDFEARPKVLLRSREGRPRPEDLAGRIFLEYGMLEDADLLEQLRGAIARDATIHALHARRRAHALTPRLLARNPGKIPVSDLAAKRLCGAFRTVEQLRASTEKQIESALGSTDVWLARVLHGVCEALVASSSVEAAAK